MLSIVEHAAVTASSGSCSALASARSKSLRTVSKSRTSDLVDKLCDNLRVRTHSYEAHGLPAPLQFEPVVAKILVEVLDHASQLLRRIHEVPWIGGGLYDARQKRLCVLAPRNRDQTLRQNGQAGVAANSKVDIAGPHEALELRATSIQPDYGAWCRWPTRQK